MALCYTRTVLKAVPSLSPNIRIRPELWRSLTRLGISKQLQLAVAAFQEDKKSTKFLRESFKQTNRYEYFKFSTALQFLLNFMKEEDFCIIHCMSCSLNIQNHTFLEGYTNNDSDGCKVFEKSAENTYNSPKVLLSNVRSLVTKIDGIREFVLRSNVHLAFITETWLRPSISDGVVSIPDFVVIGKDKRVLASTTEWQRQRQKLRT